MKMPSLHGKPRISFRNIWDQIAYWLIVQLCLHVSVCLKKIWIFRLSWSNDRNHHWIFSDHFEYEFEHIWHRKLQNSDLKKIRKSECFFFCINFEYIPVSISFRQILKLLSIFSPPFSAKVISSSESSNTRSKSVDPRSTWSPSGQELPSEDSEGVLRPVLLSEDRSSISRDGEAEITSDISGILSKVSSVRNPCNLKTRPVILQIRFP